MKTYKLGKFNDTKIYAIKDEGHYIPVEIITEEDFLMTNPDAVIYGDSGMYPGTLDELHRSWCAQADRIGQSGA